MLLHDCIFYSDCQTNASDCEAIVCEGNDRIKIGLDFGNDYRELDKEVWVGGSIVLWIF